MKEKKKSFILYDSDVACVRYLSDKQAGILFKAIAAQRKNSPLPEMGTDPALLILFDQISTHMAMNEEKYQKICEQRTKAAQKRWEQKDNSKNDAIMIMILIMILKMKMIMIMILIMIMKMKMILIL